MRSFSFAATVLLLVSGCSAADDGSQSGPGTGAERLPGDQQALADGDAYTWATLDAAGSLDELGVAITMSAIETADHSDEVFLALPAAAYEATAFDHVAINYRRHGHGPESVYDTPHFDVHVYTVDPAVRMAIDCTDEPMPDPNRIPEPYFIPSTALEPEGTCTPGMGVHALDPTSPELAVDDPAPFDHTLILGYHAGEIAFVEPMITTESLEAQEPFAYELNRPTDFVDGAGWPTRISGSYDAAADTYHMIFGGFVGAER